MMTSALALPNRLAQDELATACSCWSRIAARCLAGQPPGQLLKACSMPWHHCFSAWLCSSFQSSQGGIGAEQDGGICASMASSEHVLPLATGYAVVGLQLFQQFCSLQSAARPALTPCQQWHSRTSGSFT